LIVPNDFPPPPPRTDPAAPPEATYALDPLHDALFERHAIEVPVTGWPHSPAEGARQRLLRISAQAYNSIADYHRLADALVQSGEG
jgi:selenocysteine lyase/cysteine desulfurase